MSRAKARVNGEWVDTNLIGSARIADTWVPFGPELGGPMLESLAWPQEPVGTDFVDGDSTYNMGIRFSVTTTKNCYGVRWRVPDNSPAPAAGHIASLWTVMGEFRIRFKSFTPVPGGYMDILFDEPYPLLAGNFYTVAILTQHYVFRNGEGLWPTSPSGNIISDESKLKATTNPTEYPASSGNSWYYISPLVEI